MKEYPRFWMEKVFALEKANKLTLKAQVVYMFLCFHADKNGFTSVGKKKIAKLSGMSILSAQRGLRELEGVSVVTPYGDNGGISGKGWGRLLIPLGDNACIPKELGIIKGIKKSYKEEYKEKYGFEPLP